MDPSEALDRLERIERETSERLKTLSRGGNLSEVTTRDACFNNDYFRS